ncbi:MAG: DUF2480 family protein [Bacteroidia bacterium]
MSEIVNRVASSGLITIDMNDWVNASELVFIDIKPFLFQELIVKEKEFRDSIKNHNWTEYTGKPVGIICSSDAIIPTWAYVLIAMELQPFVAKIYQGTVNEIKTNVLMDYISTLDVSQYNDQRLVIKGCGEEFITPATYVALTSKLKPVVKSMMYGEPCSTVPLYKAPKK